MNYELAKELKDAGFPQGRSDWIYVQRNRHPNDGGWDSSCIAAPTLSELLTACGDRFGELENTFDGWRASDPGYKEVCWAKTPSEAVARLWLAINKRI